MWIIMKSSKLFEKLPYFFTTTDISFAINKLEFGKKILRVKYVAQLS